MDQFQIYSVLSSPNDSLRIFQNRLSLEEGGAQSENEKKGIRDLYEGLFDQESYLNRLFLENPLRVVIFRGGRAASSLTQLLAKDPRIRVIPVVAGTDAGRSHRIPAYDFGTPGVPDMGKALLDLAQSESMKDFVGSRFQTHNGDTGDSVEEDHLRDLEGLTEYLVNRTTNRTSLQLDAWIQQVQPFPEDEKKTLGIFFGTFLRIIKTNHSKQVI